MLDTIELSKPINWLGFHFHPILFLFVPLYQLSPSPEWLIFAQSLSIALTVIPIYKTALKLNYSEWQALVWATSFLLNPFVLSASIWDFHPVAIAAPFISLSIYYIISNKFEKLLLCILILLLCQEHFGILAICIGISYFLINKDIKKSLAIIFIGILYTIILFMYVFPALSPTGTHIMMSPEIKTLSKYNWRYNWLGKSLPEIIINLLSNPLHILKFTFVDLGGFLYILLLLMPYGMVLPILGIEILLLGLADLAANMLSLNPLPRSINGYHSITLIPVIIISTMVGLNRIRKTYSLKQYKRVMLLTLVSFVSLFIICIPHIFNKNSFWVSSSFPAKDPTLAEIQSLIPLEATLSVQSNIGSHFSQRHAIYAYPNKVSEVDFVILRIEDINESLKTNNLDFIHHMQMEPGDYLDSIQSLLDDKKYGVFYFNAPWLVLTQKQNDNPEMNSDNVIKFLDKLYTQWNIDKASLIGTSTNPPSMLQ